MFVQHGIDGVFHVLRCVGQGDELLGATVDLAPFEVHDAAAQGPVGGILVAGLDGGVDVQSPGIGFVAVLREHQLAHGFRDVFGMHALGIRPSLELELFIAGLSCLAGRDEAVFLHPVQDVQLPGTGPLGVADRVVRARRLGQAGQHRGLGDRDVLQRLVEVGFARGRETIGALPQEDLVHVDFQDLVLGEQMLHLEGQEHLVDLARVGLLRRQVDIACHLHRDRPGS